MTLLSQMEDPNYWRLRERQARKIAEQTIDQEKLEILSRLVERSGSTNSDDAVSGISA